MAENFEYFVDKSLYPIVLANISRSITGIVEGTEALKPPVLEAGDLDRKALDLGKYSAEVDRLLQDKSNNSIYGNYAKIQEDNRAIRDTIIATKGHKRLMLDSIRLMAMRRDLLTMKTRNLVNNGK